MDKDEAVIKWYQEMYRLMWSMAWQYTNPRRIAMSPDDIFAELSLELVNVVYKYFIDKDGVEMKRILITSLRNRCLDLVKYEYYTHRKESADMLSLDADVRDGDAMSEWLVEAATQFNYFDLSGLLDALSDDGKALIHEVLEPSPRLNLQIDMSITRKRHVSPKGCWKVQLTPLMLRRTLGWDKCRFETTWVEVQTVLYAVCI